MNPSPNLVVDGVIGRKSIQAIQSFQESRGLVPDGKVGPITRNALETSQTGTTTPTETATNTPTPTNTTTTNTTPTTTTTSSNTNTSTASTKICAAGAIYNAMTGELCTKVTTSLSLGCTSSTKYSPVTGVYCGNTTTQPTTTTNTSGGGGGGSSGTNTTSTSNTNSSTNTSTASCTGSSTQSCPITNGSGTQSRTCTNGIWSSYNSCAVSTCNSGYQVSGNGCVVIPTTPATCTGSATQSCTIGNGTGTQSRTCTNGTWSSFNPCAVSTCNSGYQISGNSCVAITNPTTTSSLQTGLISWWKLNGNAQDSVGINHGTVSGATLTNTNCKSGQCYNFDGINDYIDYGYGTSLNIQNSFTISAWVNSNRNNDMVIFSKHASSGNYGYALWWDANNDIEWDLSTTGSNWYGGDTPAGGISQNTWYHVVATYDLNHMRVYINGTASGGHFPRAQTGNIYTSSASTKLGSRTGGNYFSGTIDEVMIWTRALSSNEIQELYNSFDYGSPTTLTTPATCSGSATQSCSIANGAGSQSRTCSNGAWSSFGTCSVTSCNSGYQISGNTCVATPPATCSGSATQSCSIANGVGSQSRTCINGTWSSYNSCAVSTCNTGYQISGNVCVNNTGGTSNNELAGLHFTPEEVAIWRERSQSGPFRSSNDFSSNSPAIWNYILTSANRAVANSANDRYTGYWRGSGCMPVGYPGWGTDMYPYEPRPSAGGSADSVQDAGFAYLITENENYASAVRTELLWYANNPDFDFSNRTRWCDNAMDNVNPGFFIASWMLKMLHAYDYTKDSSVYSQADQNEIRDWLHEAGKYMDYIYTDTMDDFFPNRMSYNYRQVTSGGIDNVRGVPWDNGPTFYSVGDLFNNRRSNVAEFAFIAGVFFEDQQLIENGIRFFKEAIAYSYIDSSPSDMTRGTSSIPTLGWSYSSIQINSLVHMADVYARHYSTSLYDFNTRDYYNVYYPSEISNKIWYNSVRSHIKS